MVKVTRFSVAWWSPKPQREHRVNHRGYCQARQGNHDLDTSYRAISDLVDSSKRPLQ